MENKNKLKFQSGDAELEYIDSGNGEIPIIFIHGFPFRKSTWKYQLDELRNNFRVITYDCRGFGNSTAGLKTFSIDLFADDLIGLMDELKIKVSNICGLSMGGYVSLNLVKRFPGRFKKLILADTQCNADTEEGREKRFKAIELINNGGLNEYADTFIKNLFATQTYSVKPELVEEIRKMVTSAVPDSVTQTLAALANRSDTCDILEKIQIPALIICGKEDRITPPEKSEFLHKHIPGSQLVILEDAGHLSAMEQPGLFNKAVNGFLNK